VNKMDTGRRGKDRETKRHEAVGSKQYEGKFEI
jgi:hypothetical protein